MYQGVIHVNSYPISAPMTIIPKTDNGWSLIGDARTVPFRFRITARGPEIIATRSTGNVVCQQHVQNPYIAQTKRSMFSAKEDQKPRRFKCKVEDLETMPSDPEFYGFTSFSSKSVDAASFNEEIRMFLKSIGRQSQRVPTIDRKVLNFWALYHAVYELGGSAQVTRQRKWKQVAKKLRIPNSLTSVSYTLRTYFEHFLAEYERVRLARSSQSYLNQPVKFDLIRKESVDGIKFDLNRNESVEPDGVKFDLIHEESAEPDGIYDECPTSL